MASQPASVLGRFAVRVRATARDERGMALVLALLIVSALTITTAALSLLMTSNEHAYGRDRQEERAFNLAETGINNAIANLSTTQSYSYVQNASVTSGGTRSFGGGTYSWTAQKKSPAGAVTDYWTIISTGAYANVTPKVAVDVAAQNATTNKPAEGSWAYGIFVGNPSGCTNVGGGGNSGGTITLSMFVLGDLCINGNTSNKIVEPNSSGAQVVDVYVAGTLSLGSNNTVGTSSRRIRSATIVNGCFKQNQSKICDSPPAPSPNEGANSTVYASSYSSSPLSLTKPVADAVGTYAAGDWANPVCSTGSFTFDNDTTRNTSVGTFTLMTGSSYDCTVYKAGMPHVSGNEEGTISWNASTHVLHMSGVIFVDGNLQLNGGDQARYDQGTFASLWANGYVQVNGGAEICGPPSTLGSSSGTCNGTWDGDEGALTITAVNANNVSPGWYNGGTAEIDVAAYVNGLFQENGTSFVTGPVITDSASIGGTTKHTDVKNPPPGTPGAATSVTNSTWGHVVKGTWRQLPG